MEPEIIQQLVSRAISAQKNAYAPYSHYHVGAAVLTADGHIYEGANMENASYSVTICAERSALACAVSQGARKFIACAVATEDKTAPCGICRQALAEFGVDWQIIMCDPQGAFEIKRLSELLPHHFGPANLGTSQK